MDMHEHHYLDAAHTWYWLHLWTPDLLHLLRTNAEWSLEQAAQQTPHTGLIHADLNDEHLANLKQLVIGYCLETGEQVPDQLRDELLAQAAGIEPARPARPATRVKVRVHRTRDGYNNWQWTISVDGRNREMPSTRKLRPYIPSQYRVGLRWTSASYRSGNSIRECLESGSLPAQILADAIRAHYIAGLERANEAESEGDPAEQASLARMQPAILAVGGLSYRLVPVGSADLRAPLRAIRKQAREVAQAEAQQLTASAIADAQTVVQQAEQRARLIRAEIDALRARAGRAMPPEWLLSTGRWMQPDLNYPANWIVRMRISLQITSIQLSVPRWNSILSWDPLPLAERDLLLGTNGSLLEVKVSIGPEGAYVFRHIGCVGSQQTPHITDSCCMELQARPLVLTTERQVQELESALGRGMQVVNMNSLLGRVYDQYHPLIKKQLPPAIVEMIKHTRQWPTEAACTRALYPADRVSWQRETSFDEEAEMVFNTGRMPEAIRLATTVTVPEPERELEEG